MQKIKEILEKEKLLNEILNNKNCPNDINEKFNDLFSNKYYENTRKWLDSNIDLSLHDSIITELSQKRDDNQFNIKFKLDSISLYNDTEQIGYIANSEFKVKSKQSLRDLNNKWILNFLIDETNKEIAFLYLTGNKKEIISIQYNEIAFQKGKEILYSPKKSPNLKIK